MTRRPGGPSPVHRKKDGFLRRPVGPPRNDKGSGLSLRGAKRRGNPHPPSPRLPCAKGAVGQRPTEGLSEVDGPFGDDLCLDSHLFFPSAPQTLRCAPLAWVVAGTSTSLRRGGPMCPPVDGSRKEPCPGRHIGRPLQGRWKPPSTPGRTGGDRAPPLPGHREPPAAGRCP